MLAAAGLGVAAVVTYAEQRSFLVSRVNQEVGDSRIPVAVALNLIHPQGSSSRSRAVAPAGGHAPGTFETSGTYGIVLNSTGSVVESRPFTYGETPASPPALPRKLPVSQFGAHRIHLLTVNSKSGSGLNYRVGAFALKDGRTLVIAVPLRDADQTLSRLVLVEALVGGGVILSLIALGWVVIRLGLRPLDRMGRVASQIAHGDLSRRVVPADNRTEVGRLGTALNEMLAQIEGAFAERGRSEDRLRRFLADASHELRTPLASIRGYAELFRMGAAQDPAEIERAMSRIEAESARMGLLVENLLLLARLEELPEPLFETVDLVELANTTAQDTRAAAPDRQVTVQASGPVQVPGDPVQLGQVLSNLTRNAVVHTAPGTAIELSVRRDGGRAIVEVRDHGAGLPHDAGEQLFERFWRSERGRSRGPGGAGLGLSIVRAVVEAHHGSVSARNAEGGGAVFRVSLPLSRNASPSGPAAGS